MGLEIGVLHVRRSNFIQASPARVWEEFTSFDRLAAWFGQGHTLVDYEPRPGGRIRLFVEPDGQKRYFGGDIVAFEPGRELSFPDTWEVDPLPALSFVTIRLTAALGDCHVELFHHGFERLGAADGAEQLEGHETGWHMRHLAALRRIVEG